MFGCLMNVLHFEMGLLQSYLRLVMQSIDSSIKVMFKLSDTIKRIKNYMVPF